MSVGIQFRILKLFVVVCLLFVVTRGQWEDGHATCYEDAGGYACGYDTGSQGYGNQISAVSEALFGGRDGAMCGACYEIMCVNSPNCYHGAGSIKVTATDFCPSTTGPAPWCNPPRKHFDLSIPMFTKMAPYKAGIVPVKFRRISCSKTGGVRFMIHPKTNQWWAQILVHNVGADGVVSNVRIKGSKTGWMEMKRNWGQNWCIQYGLYGQDLSFQVTIRSGKTLVFNNVAPASWRNGQTFDGKINF